MNLLHSGDLGDIIYYLPVMRALPDGPHTLLLDDRNFTKPLRRRANAIIDICNIQPYVKECRLAAPHDNQFFPACQFRVHHRACWTLTDAQAMWAGIPTPPYEPWIVELGEEIEPDPDLIVVARSPRYNNEMFPWQQLMDHYRDTGKRVEFVGLPQEFHSFKVFGDHIKFRKTASLLETARVIKRSSMFIGNQSSPYAVAVGLGHPRILEVSLSAPDCYFPGAIHCYDGKLTLPDGTKFEHDPYWAMEISKSKVPPGGWAYFTNDGIEVRKNSWQQLVNFAKQHDKIPVSEAEERISYDTKKVCPRDFFEGAPRDPIYVKAKEAEKNMLAQQQLVGV